MGACGQLKKSDLLLRSRSRSKVQYLGVNVIIGATRLVGPIGCGVKGAWVSGFRQSARTEPEALNGTR